VTNSSDQGVNWAVLEGSGGTVTSAGLYTAPQTPGVYHVVAAARADSSKTDQATVTVTSAVTDLPSQLQALSAKALLFGHQSVGGQIVAGINDLLASNSGPKPTMVANARSATQVGKGIWGEFGVGTNMYPAGKIDDFIAVMNGGAGAKVDLAFMKYCFVDFYDSAPYWPTSGGTGTVNSLFAKYQSAMASLKAAYPGVTIVHFTVPLVHVDLYPYAGNERREAYSNLLRTAYAGKEPVFDLALIESTRADGTRCTDGKGVPALCGEYGLPNDDGHLNSTAKVIVAQRLVAFLAALP
jgi:hypothetical protein